MSEATLAIGSCQLRFVVYVGIIIIVRALWGQRSAIFEIIALKTAGKLHRKRVLASLAS